jgi:tetratricopeptide (TPR) repeat protein
VPSHRLVWLALALAACSPSEESAREQAQRALSRGERTAAIEAIEALRKASPETPEAYLEQAALWVRAGEAPRAVWLLDEGVTRFPERGDLRVMHASTALLVGDPARADGIAQAIPESAPEYPEALLVRARAQVSLGDLEGGLATFRRAETMRPDRADLRIPRVAALLEERRFVEARAALDEAYGAFEAEEPRALLRNVQLVLLQVQATDALRRAGEAELAGDGAARDQARREVEEAIVGVRGLAGRAPDDAMAWQTMTSLAVAAGMPELAESALRAALTDDPQRLGLYPLLASVAIAKGDDAEAERQLRALVEHSDAPAARVALARYLAGRGRMEEALALMASSLETHPDDEILRFAHADLLLDAGQLDAAAPALERVPSSPANEPVLELLRARLLLARGDAAGARERLEQLAPRLDTSMTQYWLARALEASDDAAGAAHRYRLAAVRDPAAPGPWLGLLRLAQQRGDWRESRAAAAAVLQRAPQVIAGWQGLVAAQLEEGQREAALVAADRAVAVLPEAYEARVLKAQAQRALGQHEEALTTLKEAQAKFGEQREIAAERVLVLGFAGRFLEARSEATRAGAMLGDFAALHYALAAASYQDGKAELGDAEVDRALELDPNDLRPLGLRCQFEAATGRWEEAVRSCEEHAAKHPEHEPTLFALGVTQAALGQFDEAEKNYRRAAAIDARAVAPRNNLAVLLAERGDLDGAIASAQEAYNLAGENAAVIDTLGHLYLKKGLTERAISLLEEAHRRDPELADAQLHLAQAYRAAGRNEESERLLEALRGRRVLSPELRAELDATTRTR